MIDLDREQLVLLSAASKSIPGRPHVSTVRRWTNRGIHGVKLETILCGGKRYTSREALQRFFSRTTAAADGETIPRAQDRQRQIEAVERNLESEGI